MAGNLTRYSYWQLRDFVRERGIALLLVCVLLGSTFIGPMKAFSGPNLDDLAAKKLLLAGITQVVYIAAFIALNGLVSTDRKLGYYRFLFSKPVSIPAYYAQYFVVSVIGFVIVFAILFGIFSVLVHPVNPVGGLIACAVVYLALGGIAFLISSLFRYDWPILAGVYLGSVIANAFWEYSTGWRHVIRSVLPPLHKLNAVVTDLVNTGSTSSQGLVWLLGYSALCFVAGLIVLWRRPIG